MGQKRYINSRTGATRVSSQALGYPYVEATDTQAAKIKKDLSAGTPKSASRTRRTGAVKPDTDAQPPS